MQYILAFTIHDIGDSTHTNALQHNDTVANKHNYIYYAYTRAVDEAFVLNLKEDSISLC